jgi:uncharacterized protein YozE (UPF0346 family)
VLKNLFSASIDLNALKISNKCYKTISSQFGIKTNTDYQMISVFKESQADFEFVRQIHNYCLQENLANSSIAKRQIAVQRVAICYFRVKEKMLLMSSICFWKITVMI